MNAEQLVSRLQAVSLEDVGAEKWVANHGVIVRLSMQAAIEAASNKEETVHYALISSNKLSVLVRELVSSELWRERVFPQLSATNSTLLYSIFYNEGCVLALLESVLYHCSACEALGDFVIDLIDYCHRALSSVVGFSESEKNVNKNLNPETEQLLWTFPLRCVAILRFIAGHYQNLSEAVTSRMFSTFDVPLLAAGLIEIQPWLRTAAHSSKLMIFRDNQWTLCTEKMRHHYQVTEIHPVQSHIWLLLVQLLLSPSALRKYAINSFRKEQLLKLRKHLNERLIDQLPVLGQFRNFLTQISLGEDQNYNNGKSFFILEMVAELQDSLLQDFSQNKEEILRYQKLRLNPQEEDLQQHMKILAAAYDLDLLEAAVQNCAGIMSQKDSSSSKDPPPDPLCDGCGQKAQNRCSRCRNSFYCSKECQAKQWTAHKKQCKPIPSEID